MEVLVTLAAILSLGVGLFFAQRRFERWREEKLYGSNHGRGEKINLDE